MTSKLWIVVLAWSIVGAASAAQDSAPRPSPTQEKKDRSADVPVLPKGRKLVLKDGSFQLVRQYELKGERVRYYSVERSAWEEIPADLVNWEATRKAEAQEATRNKELVEKVRADEAARQAELLTDVDASVQVAPGIFLPPGEGVYVVEGKTVLPLVQVGANIKLDKGNFVKQVLVPIPVVPTRHKIQIPGSRAQTRITTTQPEFYLREAPDSDQASASASSKSRSKQTATREPEFELVRAQVKGGTRQIETLSTQITGQQSAQRKSIAVQRWEIAKGLYRLTLSQALEPGEYALAEILPAGMNLYVWDFGVDTPAAKPSRAPRVP
ncbi:MAG TPA: hypothetical protein VKE24_12695 [Candidatus Acidoferrales bacterium]|nr:hypothetical protein [Candidatus Acidoferrales bacterium]